ncbi:hypothetical protein BJX96DRAFT_8329 [Aspergillus floccosus]
MPIHHLSNRTHHRLLQQRIVTIARHTLHRQRRTLSLPPIRHSVVHSLRQRQVQTPSTVHRWRTRAIQNRVVSLIVFLECRHVTFLDAQQTQRRLCRRRALLLARTIHVGVRVRDWIKEDEGGHGPQLLILPLHCHLERDQSTDRIAAENHPVRVRDVVLDIVCVDASLVGEGVWALRCAEEGIVEANDVESGF